MAAEGEEGLVLVEEDEGGGRAEVLVLDGDDAAREQVDDLERRVLLLEQQLLVELLDELHLLSRHDRLLELDERRTWSGLGLGLGSGLGFSVGLGLGLASLSTYVLLPSSGRVLPAILSLLKVRVVKQSSASTAEAWSAEGEKGVFQWRNAAPPNSLITYSSTLEPPDRSRPVAGL